MQVAMTRGQSSTADTLKIDLPGGLTVSSANLQLFSSCRPPCLAHYLQMSLGLPIEPFEIISSDGHYIRCEDINGWMTFKIS